MEGTKAKVTVYIIQNRNVVTNPHEGWKKVGQWYFATWQGANNNLQLQLKNNTHIISELSSPGYVEPCAMLYPSLHKRIAQYSANEWRIRAIKISSQSNAYKRHLQNA